MKASGKKIIDNAGKIGCSYQKLTVLKQIFLLGHQRKQLKGETDVDESFLPELGSSSLLGSTSRELTIPEPTLKIPWQLQTIKILDLLTSIRILVYIRLEIIKIMKVSIWVFCLTWKKMS